MNLFGFDASALAKRYSPEVGSDLVDHLFRRVSKDRFLCLMAGAAEVVSVLVRHRNNGAISSAACSQAMSNLRAEVIDAADFLTLPADNDIVVAALPFIDLHALNAHDAVVLRVCLDLAAQYKTHGDELVLLASDQRLLRAARAEGMATFDPETQSLLDLDALIDA